MTWIPTPFLTIEGALQYAEAMGLQPSPLSTQGEGADALRTFSTRALLVAQRASGPPAPVLQKEVGQRKVRRIQDPRALRFHEHKRLGVGPWVLTQHSSLEEAVAHRVRNVTNFKPPTRKGRLVVFAEPKGEFIEYLDMGGGKVLARSLRPVYHRQEEQ